MAVVSQEKFHCSIYAYGKQFSFQYQTIFYKLNSLAAFNRLGVWKRHLEMQFEADLKQTEKKESIEQRSPMIFGVYRGAK